MVFKIQLYVLAYLVFSEPKYFYKPISYTISYKRCNCSGSRGNNYAAFRKKFSINKPRKEAVCMVGKAVSRKCYLDTDCKDASAAIQSQDHWS